MFGGRLPSSRAKRTPSAIAAGCRAAPCAAVAGAANASAANSGVFAFSRGLNVAVYLYACASVASAAVRTFQAASLPGTSTSVRYDTALSSGRPLSARAASLQARWKRAASNFFCSPRPTTSTRGAATFGSANSSWLLPGLPVMSPASIRRLIAPPDFSSIARGGAGEHALLEHADDDAGRGRWFPADCWVRLNWMVMDFPSNWKKGRRATCSAGRLHLRCLERGAMFNSADARRAA